MAVKARGDEGRRNQRAHGAMRGESPDQVLVRMMVCNRNSNDGDR